MDIHPIIFVDDNSRYLRLVETIVEQTGIYVRVNTVTNGGSYLLTEGSSQVLT